MTCDTEQSHAGGGRGGGERNSAQHTQQSVCLRGLKLTGQRQLSADSECPARISHANYGWKGGWNPSRCLGGSGNGNQADVFINFLSSLMLTYFSHILKVKKTCPF